MPKLQQSTIGNPVLSPGGVQAATAGTTQTQAGATVITAPMVNVTTGNANDGVALPDASNAANNGQAVLVTNVSANALKVYAAVGSSGTIDGGGANAAATHAASASFFYVQTAANTWKSIKTS